MAHTDARLGQLGRIHLDGVPLDLASRLLPWRSRLDLGLLSHLHLHARSQAHFADRGIGDVRIGRRPLRPGALRALIEHLERTVKRLEWRPGRSAWLDYYDHTTYSTRAAEEKTRLVAEWLDRIGPRTVWDLGANTGAFSRLAARNGALTVAFDADVATVDRHFRDCVARAEERVLPLVLDLTNPSPSLGWHHRERASLRERGPADLVLALALAHHLAIGNNVPLADVADFLSDVGRALVIEFVPKGDPQVERLLASREDVFPDYGRDGFERAFASRFTLHTAVQLPDCERILYVMERRGEAGT
jgi:hypothetical protein